ncbi:DUF6169 family protein [Spirosoma validum]|uniref:Uncharacterized protein n=1 Tax=Spirosoma validum TaxID=2771355 RepID=A0A927GG18_9BACT|nr:DUF6169 family protein [Spirosoma validum]MBD2756414.1 hypothetical protein [Spirosoma validum]
MNLNQSPYEFEYVGGASNSYVFETTNEVTYQVKFKPTPYLFVNFPKLGEQVYELVIELVYRPTADKLRADPAIGPTVLAICRDFFANKERILLYICETADARHLARVRKFDAWFREFTTSKFLKLDIQFPDTNGLTYYISLIFRRNHPDRHIIIDEFDVLAQQYDPDK